MLRVDDAVVRYGAATALDGVTLEVQKGEFASLIGANGAGKSTLVNAVSGLVSLSSGTVEVDGRVAQVPEGRQMFGDMTVEDNLLLGAWRSKDKSPDDVYSLFPDLVRMRRQRAGTLSGGQQQMVAVGRALMGRPDLLVIDELSLGLAPIVVAEIADHLVTLNRETGTTILLIEQEVALAFRITSRTYVLDSGRILAAGTSAEMAASDVVRRAYLGELPGEETIDGGDRHG